MTIKHIKSGFSEDLAKKILGNAETAAEYLLRLNAAKPVPALKFRVATRGKNAGKKVLALNSREIWKAVVDSWDYEPSKEVIRSLFRETDKYKAGKEADEVMRVLIKEWRALKLGGIAWPFSQGAFDEFVQRVNSEKKGGSAKDKEVKDAAVKYRRIKEINTVRNDFIETLVFEKNEDILPTLSHRRGVDFFINGISFDQKVAKSPTSQFKRDFGDGWRDAAIKNPKVVAEYLYRHQDEGRFDADPRLLVVYIDEDVSIGRIREIIGSTDLTRPSEINFTYSHKALGEKSYKAHCFVILLHN